MEEDNARAGDFLAADDPFGGSGRVGYVRALVPDVALVHGWVADRAGNVIIGTPMNENLYGAMAARRGAVVTVERIVPSIGTATTTSCPTESTPKAALHGRGDRGSRRSRVRLRLAAERERA